VAVNGRNRALLAHLSLALGRYATDVRRDGLTPPPELLLLAELFADCATARQDATTFQEATGAGNDGPMKEHPLMTKREVAASLRCSTRTVDRLLASGKLTAVRVGGATRVRRSDLADYIAGLSARSFRDSVQQKETA